MPGLSAQRGMPICFLRYVSICGLSRTAKQQIHGRGSGSGRDGSRLVGGQMGIQYSVIQTGSQSVGGWAVGSIN
jgi:hypothetical protein